MTELMYKFYNKTIDVAFLEADVAFFFLFFVEPDGRVDAQTDRQTDREATPRPADKWQRRVRARGCQVHRSIRGVAA